MGLGVILIKGYFTFFASTDVVLSHTKRKRETQDLKRINKLWLIHRLSNYISICIETESGESK